jgi:predicted DNA-binding protein (MmcQ/YjbR family)
MDAESARRFARSLPYAVETASDTARWGDKIVFRVGDQAAGGKMFCQIDFGKDGRAILSFAAGRERFDELIAIDGVIPAPYRARLHWVALMQWDAIGESRLKRLLHDAMELTLASLPKRTRDVLTRGGGKSSPLRSTRAE